MHPTLAEGTPNGVTGCNVISTWPPGEMCHGNGVSRGLEFGGLFSFGLGELEVAHFPSSSAPPSPFLSAREKPIFCGANSLQSP